MTTGTMNTTIARSASRSLILLTMCLGVLVAQIDTSVVNLALKHIAADLNANVSQLQWVVDSYNLTYATLLLTGGVLADLYGRRRIFAIGLALFTIGSLICGFAPTLPRSSSGAPSRASGRRWRSRPHWRSSLRSIPIRTRARCRSASGRAATGWPSSLGRHSAAYWSIMKAGAASSC